MADQILYLEGDHLWAELVKPELAKHGGVKVAGSEYEFRGAIDELAKDCCQWPSAVVLEQRVRWTYPNPNQPIRPPKLREEGHTNAGVRCYEYLRQAQRGQSITPVIFYSTVEPENILHALLNRGLVKLPYDFQFVGKDSSFGDLHQALRRVM